MKTTKAQRNAKLGAMIRKMKPLWALVRDEAGCWYINDGSGFLSDAKSPEAALSIALRKIKQRKEAE